MQEGPKRMGPLRFEIGRKGPAQLPGRRDTDYGGIPDRDAADQRQFTIQCGARLIVGHPGACHRVFEGEKRVTADNGRAVGGTGDPGAGKCRRMSDTLATSTSLARRQ